MQQTSAPDVKPGTDSHGAGGRQRSQFLVLAANMTWQLALVVMVPVIAGVELDKHFGTKYVCTFIGLGMALLGSAAIMWRTMQVANRLPVPKLTEKEKRAIRKQYEEEDDD
jgi:uncharacterized membrane protein